MVQMTQPTVTKHWRKYWS